MTDRFLDKAYGHGGGEEARRFYDEWAASYDEEIAENGYATPRRCAEALIAAGAEPDWPILDVGCGTGLSGAALRLAGFTRIDGVDPSPEMLKRAELRRLYRMLREIDPAAPLTAPAGIYRAAVAVGSMSPGLAPPEAIDQALAFLPSGGVLVFSLNDHAVEDGAHLARLRDVVDAGAAAIAVKEHGEHLPKIGLKSWVYALRKT